MQLVVVHCLEGAHCLILRRQMIQCHDIHSRHDGWVECNNVAVPEIYTTLFLCSLYCQILWVYFKWSIWCRQSYLERPIKKPFLIDLKNASLPLPTMAKSIAITESQFRMHHDFFSCISRKCPRNRFYLFVCVENVLKFDVCWGVVDSVWDKYSISMRQGTYITAESHENRPRELTRSDKQG